MSQAYWLLMPIVGISMSKEKDAIDIDMSLTRNWTQDKEVIRALAEFPTAINATIGWLMNKPIYLP